MVETVGRLQPAVDEWRDTDVVFQNYRQFPAFALGCHGGSPGVDPLPDDTDVPTLDVNAFPAARPAEVERESERGVVDGARLRRTVDPDFERRLVAVRLDVGDRRQQLLERIGSVVRDDDQTKVNYFRVDARHEWFTVSCDIGNCFFVLRFIIDQQNDVTSN